MLAQALQVLLLYLKKNKASQAAGVVEKRYSVSPTMHGTAHNVMCDRRRCTLQARLTDLHSPKWSRGNTPFSGGRGWKPRAPPNAPPADMPPPATLPPLPPTGQVGESAAGCRRYTRQAVVTPQFDELEASGVVQAPGLLASEQRGRRSTRALRGVCAGAQKLRECPEAAPWRGTRVSRGRQHAADSHFAAKAWIPLLADHLVGIRSLTRVCSVRDTRTTSRGCCCRGVVPQPARGAAARQSTAQPSLQPARRQARAGSWRRAAHPPPAAAATTA